MRIVDAHLDLSHNAISGRDVTRPAHQQPTDTDGIPTVGLPDLRAGGVSLIFATIFCMPADAAHAGYHNADQAHADATHQLAWYTEQIERKTMRWITRAEELTQLGDRHEGDAQPAVLLLEGADALRDPADLPTMFNAGLRIVGLAWRGTRYAGGTGVPGPLTPDGLAMVDAIDALGIIHDASHLAEQSFWDLLDRSGGPVIASHSNCRSIVPTDRQLSDAMLRAIAQRGGVVGINFFDKFLLPPTDYKKRRATLADVVHHIQHICNVIGSAGHVGIGTDMDGGLGRDEIPIEIQTSADLPQLADALSAAGFGDEDIARIMGENWMRFLARYLP